MPNENRAARRAGLTKRILGSVLLLCCVVTAETHAVHPGAYVCAVDNCKKAYREQAPLFEACREGAAHAVNSSPASAACMQMCKKTYGDDKGAVRDACTTGCALYPERCLRFGELPPRDR